MSLVRTVSAARYVMPFKEGSSVPALVEGDDLGLYVVKLRGAGQGEKALIAELLAGELARALGLSVPEIVLVELDRALAATEPDPEIFDPLDRSAGLNLGLDYLPGSITYDPIASPRPDALEASRLVLLDAFVTNVDRTPRNPNLLVWHKRPWLIDHGAALYFHHGFDPAKPLEGSDDPFVEVKSHVLGRWATKLDEAADHFRRTIDDRVIDGVVDALPESWLSGNRRTEDAATRREVYRTWLRARRDALPVFLEEAQRAHARLRLRHHSRRPGRRARRVR